MSLIYIATQIMVCKY